MCQPPGTASLFPPCQGLVSLEAEWCGGASTGLSQKAQAVQAATDKVTSTLWSWGLCKMRRLCQMRSGESMEKSIGDVWS